MTTTTKQLRRKTNPSRSSKLEQNPAACIHPVTCISVLTLSAVLGEMNTGSICCSQNLFWVEICNIYIWTLHDVPLMLLPVLFQYIAANQFDKLLLMPQLYQHCAWGIGFSDPPAQGFICAPKTGLDPHGKRICKPWNLLQSCNCEDGAISPQILAASVLWDGHFGVRVCQMEVSLFSPSSAVTEQRRKGFFLQTHLCSASHLLTSKSLALSVTHPSSISCREVPSL